MLQTQSFLRHETSDLKLFPEPFAFLPCDPSIFHLSALLAKSFCSSRIKIRFDIFPCSFASIFSGLHRLIDAGPILCREQVARGPGSYLVRGGWLVGAGSAVVLCCPSPLIHHNSLGFITSFLFHRKIFGKIRFWSKISKKKRWNEWNMMFLQAFSVNFCGKTLIFLNQNCDFECLGEEREHTDTPTHTRINRLEGWWWWGGGRGGCFDSTKDLQKDEGRCRDTDSNTTDTNKGRPRTSLSFEKKQKVQKVEKRVRKKKSNKFES